MAGICLELHIAYAAVVLQNKSRKLSYLVSRHDSWHEYTTTQLAAQLQDLLADLLAG